VLTRDLFAVANLVNLTCDKVHTQTDRQTDRQTDGRAIVLTGVVIHVDGFCRLWSLNVNPHRRRLGPQYLGRWERRPWNVA